MNVSQLILVVLLVVLVGALFVLALAETSLLKVRRSAAAVEAEAGDRQAAELVRLLDDLPRVLNAVLLTVLLVQVIAATTAGALARDWFGGAGVTIATAVTTFVLFIYGEAIPKTLAVQRPLPVARRLASPTRWLSVALRPVVSVLVGIARAQTGGAAINPVGGVSEAELRHLAGDAASTGNIDPSDAELIERAFVFGDLMVDQILVPRSDVVAVSSDTRVDAALQTAIAAGHRRLPVYEGEIDRIVGFVRMRDLAEAARIAPDSMVARRRRDVLEVPEATPVADLLRVMQQSRRHMAVILDERGDTAGIVTIEDVVEELVGTIEEE